MKDGSSSDWGDCGVDSQRTSTKVLFERLIALKTIMLEVVPFVLLSYCL